MNDDWQWLWCSECRQFANECECEPPTKEELDAARYAAYSTELDGALREWWERANAPTFSLMFYLRKRFEQPDRLIEVASRASPFLRAVAHRA